MYGLVEIDLAADGGRGQHAERAGDDAGLVGEDVAEEVLGEHDVEVARDVHDVHRHGVDELMFERDVGIVFRDLGDGGAPELRDFEDVGLVDGGDFVAALAGELEGDAGYADDFGLGVAHGVDGFVGFLVPPARRAEVEAAEEFADEENVDVFGDLGAQRGAVGERGVGDGGTQVGEAAEGLADLQQAGFGALVGGEGVEFVVADSAEQDGVAVERGVERCGGERGAGFGDGDAADEAFDEGEVVAAEFGYRAKDVGGFAGDFGADAVAGEDCNFETHYSVPLRSSAARA